MLSIPDSATVTTPEVSVIVPLFNEEGSIAQLQMELESALKEISHELVFVDDGSSDRTIERINRAPWVHILEFEKNTGQSAAMYAGCRYSGPTTSALWKIRLMRVHRR